MIVEYSTNNSGGDWWVTTEDWLKLEKAGWTVVWGGLYFCHSPYSTLLKISEGKSQPCASTALCPGHRSFDSYEEMTPKDAFLRSYAKEAYKDFPTMRAAVEEWQEVLGLDATAEGCNCCGAPHSFRTKKPDPYEYASGEDLLAVLGYKMVRVKIEETP